MPADIGILFVHGIGSQIRGETLVKFGEPIFGTLKSSFETAAYNNVGFSNSEEKEIPGKPGGKVRLLNAFLSPVQNGTLQQSEPSPITNEFSQQAEPAHVRFEIADDPWQSS